MSYQSEVLADSPIRYWTLDDTSGTAAVDATGTANGTYSGSPTLGATGLITAGTAMSTALASSQYMSGPISGLGSPGTIEFWWRFDGTGTSIVLFRDHSSGAGSGTFLQLASSGANSPVLRYTGTDRTLSGILTSAIRDGNRHHFAIVNTGTQIITYVDGTAIDTWTSTRNASSIVSPLYLGKNGSSATYYTGTFDELAVYSTALSSTRVGVHWTAGTTTPSKTIVLGGTAPAPVAAFTAARTASTVALGGVAPAPVAAFAATAVVATLALGGVAPAPEANIQITDASTGLVTSAGVAPAPVAAFTVARTASTVATAGVAPVPTAAFAVTRPAATVALGGIAPDAVAGFTLDAFVDDGFTCVDLDDAVIMFDTGTLIGGELVPAAGEWVIFGIPAPVLEADTDYQLRVAYEGETGVSSSVYAATAPDLATLEAEFGTYFLTSHTAAYDHPHIYTFGSNDLAYAAEYDAAVTAGAVYVFVVAPADATITQVCWAEVEAPTEIDEPAPVEVDTDLVEVPPVDQADHEAEWHDYPALGTLAATGARDVAFVLDVDGNAIYKSKPRDRDRVFAKNGAGAWDITVVNGKRTQVPDYQRMKPGSYGPGSLQVHGINPILDDLSAYPWLAPWTKIFVQRIDEEDQIAATDYRCRVTSIDVSGAETTLDLGGMLSGPAAVQWRPKPLIRRRETPTYWLHAMFRKNRMPLDNVDLGFGEVTSPAQGWHLNCILDVVAGAVKRNGDALTIAYDEDAKKYVASLVDRDTIHATVYLDHGYMKPDLTRDFSAEKNEVYAAGHDEDGDKILFAVAPGMEQVTPVPDYPLASGDPFGEGTVDADTTDGAGISRLLLRLITLGYLRRDDKSGGFDEDVALAVADARVDAKLDDYGIGDPTLEEVDEDLWAWLWDAEATGLTMKEARIRPAYQVPALGAYNFTATGQLKGANLAYDPSLIPVSEVVDFTTSMRKGQMKKRARRYVFDGPNWSGTITAGVTGVIAGEHNPGDPFDAADVLSTRDVREGWNLWVPNFEGGTLFHVSGIDVSDDGFNVRFMVDTQARDTLTINEILDRQEQNRLSPSKAFWKQASGNYGKDTITGSLGEIGGKIGTDVFCPAGQWTVLPIPLGDYGMVSQIRTRLRAYTEDTETTFEGSSPNATTTGVEHVTMVFGQDVRTNNTTRESAFLDARRPDPFSSGDLDDVKAAIDDFKSKRMLGSWGGENEDDSFSFCGYGDFSSDSGTLSGNFFDDSGFPFRAPDCLAYVAVYVQTPAVFISGRVLWWQLEEGT